jgi:hypothetical protein
MYVCSMHTHARARAHTHTHTHIEAHIHTYIHTYTLTQRGTHHRAHHTCIRAYTYMHSLSLSLSLSLSHTHTHTALFLSHTHTNTGRQPERQTHLCSRGAFLSYRRGNGAPAWRTGMQCDSCVCVCVRAWSVECERKNTDIKCMFFGGEMFSSEKNSEKNKWMDAQNGCFVCQLGREPKKIVCQCKNDCLSM